MPPDAGEPHRLEHVERRDDVLVEVAPGRVPAEADVGVGGEVDDGVGAVDDLAEPITVRDEVELDEREALGAAGGVEELATAGAEVVDAGDAVTVGEQSIHQVRADEAGCAGDHDVHQGSTSVDAERLTASQTSDVPIGVGTRPSRPHTPANARPTREGPATDAVGYGRRRTFEYQVVTGMNVRP